MGHLKIPFYVYLFTLCGCGAGGGRSEDNLWESVLSFQQLSPGDRTLLIKFDSRHLYHLSHHASPTWLLLNFLWNGTTNFLTISLIKVLGEGIYRTLAVPELKFSLGEKAVCF